MLVILYSHLWDHMDLPIVRFHNQNIAWWTQFKRLGSSRGFQCLSRIMFSVDGIFVPIFVLPFFYRSSLVSCN